MVIPKPDKPAGCRVQLSGCRKKKTRSIGTDAVHLKTLIHHEEHEGDT